MAETMTNKPAKVTFHSGQGEGVAKHNDRSMYAYGYEHRAENLHWDRYGIGFEGSDAPSVDAELRFYEEQFGDTLRATNERYIRNGHPERCKSMDDYREAHPLHESIIQLGGVESRDNCSVDQSAAFAIAAAERVVERFERAGLTVVSWDVHMDEKDGTPHLHARWTGIDSKGKPNVNGCLAEHGCERPEPAKKRTRSNTELAVFTAKQREWLEDLGETVVAEVSRERDPNARHIANGKFQSNKRREERELTLLAAEDSANHRETLLGAQMEQIEGWAEDLLHEAHEQAERAERNANTMLEAARTEAWRIQAEAERASEDMLEKAEQERLDAHQLKEDALEAQARAMQDQNERQPLWRAVEFIAIKCEETGFDAVAKFLRSNVQPIVSKWEAEWQAFNERMDVRVAERNAQAKRELRNLSGRPSPSNDYQLGD